MVKKKILLTMWAVGGVAVALFTLAGALTHRATPALVDGAVVAAVILAWSAAFWVAVFAITSPRPNSWLSGALFSVPSMALPLLAVWRLAFSDTDCGSLIIVLSFVWGAVVALIAVVVKRSAQSSNTVVAAD